MSAESRTNLDILKSFLQQFQSGDWKGACEQYCDENFQIHEPPGIPQQGVFKGRYASIEVTEIYRGIWDFAIGSQEFWEADSGEVVFSRYELTWTSKATGKSLTQPALEINRFRDGKLAKMEVFLFNPIGLMETLNPGDARAPS